MKELKVNDMFVSISGEACLMGQGVITAFVRLHGCNMVCPYCDTIMADDDYRLIELETVCDWLEKQQVHHILFTGGEPLLQLGYDELEYIINRTKGFADCITVETNGTIKPPYFFALSIGLSFVMDWKLFKTPDIEIYRKRMPNDFIKFVCFDMADVQKALSVMRDRLKENTLAHFVLSLAGNLVSGGYTANIVSLCHSYGLNNVIITTQLHKLLEVK